MRQCNATQFFFSSHKGNKSCRMGRFTVRPYVRLYVRPFPPLWALQPGLRPSQAWGGTYGRTDERTDKQTYGKSPHSTGLRPLSGPLPKKLSLIKASTYRMCSTNQSYYIERYQTDCWTIIYWVEVDITHCTLYSSVTILYCLYDECVSLSNTIQFNSIQFKTWSRPDRALNHLSVNPTNLGQWP